MVAAVRAVTLFLLLASVTLSGCIGGDDGSGSGLESPTNMDALRALTRPLDDPPDIPACTLVPGDIAWPEMPGAPAPTGPVEVTFKTDAYGVTHVYADDAYSLWYGNGYVQARDRLFQMDLLRLVGRGESARYLGPGQLASDYEVHRELYTAEEVEAQWQAAPESGKQVLQAYADGVNRFITEAIASDSLPSEFAAVGRVPPAWTPQDSVAVINYLIGFFGVDGGKELSNLQHLAQFESVLGEAAAWDAFSDYAWLREEDTYTTIAPEDRSINGCEDPLPDAADAAMQRASGTAALGATTFGLPPGGSPGVARPGPLVDGSYDGTPGKGLFEGFHWGSNALLVDGSITETGQPIMWGAPQMGLYKPNIPYQVGLHGAGWDMAGMGVPGAPAVVIGRNPHIAWSATSGMEDQVDLIEVEMPVEGTYVWDGEEREMDCWEVEHQTAPAPADFAEDEPPDDPPMVYSQTVCRAEGWPVVAANEAEHKAWIKKTTTRNEELMGALIWLSVGQATSAEEFHDMVEDFPFTFNFHVADEDNVHYIHTGDIPLRADGYDVRLPTPSGDAYDWQGEAYTMEMDTWATDPSRGYFANWNNGPAYGWRSGDQPYLWGPVHRVHQIEYWLQDRIASTDGALSWQDVADVNWLASTHDPFALAFLPYLLDAAATDEDLADIHAALSDWAEAGAPLRDQDGDGDYDDPAHAVWDFMLHDMVDRIEGDEFGALLPTLELDPPLAAHNGDHGVHDNKLTVVMKALAGTSMHDWCDDATTPATEACTEQLVAGLHAAKRSLTSDHGEDVAGWNAPIHENRFRALGGSNADVRPWVNRGSWIQVVSMAEPERSGSVSPPGNSGLLTTAELAILVATGEEPPRLTAEMDLYWSGTYKPFPLTKSEVDAVAVATETLQVLALPA